MKNKIPNICNASVLFAILVLLVSCQSNQPQVVVYTSVDQVFSEPVLREFEKETGIKVKAVYDTEETKSTGVLNRLIAEKDNPRCDVFWSGDPVRTIVLKNREITESYRSKVAEDIPAVYKDKDGHWTGFSARARVLIYNKDLLPPDSVPLSIFELTEPRLKGQVAIANPLFGTTTFHIAAIFTALGDSAGKAMLEKLKKNRVVIATSNGDVKKRVVSGEVACGLTDTDDAFEAVNEGANVGIVFLDQKSGLGTLVMPNTLCMIKDCPNPQNAKKLIDYLLSRKTEAALARSCAQMPLHSGVEVPENIPSLDHIIPMKINYDEAGLMLEQIQPFLKNWVEN